MYNRYIPEDISFSRVEGPVSAGGRPVQNGTAPGNQPRRPAFRLPDFLSGTGDLLSLGREGGGLPGLLKSLHLDQFDSGDLLLLLILLYLLKEGDDLDLVIALGAVLLMGLWEDDT